VNIAVIGVGAVGARTVRQLASSEGVDRVLVFDADAERARAVAEAIGAPVEVLTSPTQPDVSMHAAVLAGPAQSHGNLARDLVGRGIGVVSTSDSIADATVLLDLDAEARERGVTVVAGAGFAPGLSCVLARHAAAGFDRVEEIHVARAGTGGPACARQYHAALARNAVDWRDGGWVHRRAGSGRELCWFPDPVGAADCYRAELPDALLLVAAFPGVDRVTARLAANRRNRLTARFPMLRRPHPEGGPGAVRVEVRGRRGGGVDTVVFGAIDRPALAAGAVAALSALAVATGRVARPGAGGLAAMVEPVPFLTELARRGVKAAVFEGDAAPVAS
jgi:hypothetical protein